VRAALPLLSQGRALDDDQIRACRVFHDPVDELVDP
jgi:hypothetical protein